MSINILEKEYDIATTIELDLSCNMLKSLPDSIGMLSNLQELYLYYNNLSSIPESILILTNLQVLSLTNNNLTSLPDSIGILSNLKTLYLNYNNLTSLPESIGMLSNLKYLYLSHNKLTRIWVDKKPCFLSIATLTKIKHFKLDESSYDINNLSMDCHTLVLTYIKNNITNLPPTLRTLYLKSNINVDMIKLPYGCDIIRF